MSNKLRVQQKNGPIAGTIMGIGNSVTCLSGILFPLVVQKITAPDIYDSELWLYCFYIIAGFSWISALFFLIFGSGEIQEWAKVDEHVEETA